MENIEKKVAKIQLRYCPVSQKVCKEGGGRYRTTRNTVASLYLVACGVAFLLKLLKPLLL